MTPPSAAGPKEQIASTHMRKSSERRNFGCCLFIQLPSAGRSGKVIDADDGGLRIEDGEFTTVLVFLCHFLASLSWKVLSEDNPCRDPLPELQIAVAHLNRANSPHSYWPSVPGIKVKAVFVFFCSLLKYKTQQSNFNVSVLKEKRSFLYLLPAI